MDKQQLQLLTSQTAPFYFYIFATLKKSCLKKTFPFLNLFFEIQKQLQIKAVALTKTDEISP